MNVYVYTYGYILTITKGGLKSIVCMYVIRMAAFISHLPSGMHPQ